MVHLGNTSITKSMLLFFPCFKNKNYDLELLFVFFLMKNTFTTLQCQIMHQNLNYVTICASYAINKMFHLKLNITFSDNVITLRGCSTKRPVYFFECENHMTGLKNEQVCYCSFDLCNRSVFACRASFCFCICASLLIIKIVR